MTIEEIELMQVELEPLYIQAVEARRDAAEKQYATAMWIVSGAEPSTKPMGAEELIVHAQDAGRRLREAVELRCTTLGLQAPPPVMIADDIPTLTGLANVWGHLLLGMRDAD